jgi:hypothetical protein
MTESNQSSNEDEVWRIRLRHKAALDAGMSNAEASAYANDPASILGCSQSQPPFGLFLPSRP